MYGNPTTFWGKYWLWVIIVAGVLLLAVVAGVVFLVWKRKRISNSRLTNSLELYTEEKKKTSFDA